MNLLFKKLTGQLHSTDRVERYIMAEEERIVRYRQVEKSPELKEYFELKKVVESREFQQKKYNWVHTKYKSTQTYATIHEYKELLHDKKLQMFLEMENSQRLKDFLEFRQSENYIKLQSAKEVRYSLELKQMAAFEKSKEYKSYLAYRDSKLPARFKALVAEIATDEFKKEHAFWTNPKRWRTTEEYQQEARFKRLSAMEDIIFFLRQDKNEIERKEEWKLVFEDEFQWLKMSDSKWRAGFAYDNPKLLRHHSYAQEQQAYNAGKNTGTVDNQLHVFVKKEKATSPAWDSKKGFVNKEFDYTSDFIQTADNFRLQGGQFVAKIRVEGRVHHAFWLGNGTKMPMISLFHYNGKHITVGNYTEKGFDGTVIRGINPKQYYLYSLSWTDKELIWYVNNVEVYRTNHDIPKEKLFMAVTSFIDEAQRAMEGQISVAWLRVFEHQGK